MCKLKCGPSLIKKISLSILVIAGCWHIWSGSYIYVKAQFAQYLLNNAWSKTVAGDNKVKPWSWADTYPVAKLSFPNLEKDLIVLEGGSGRTMAFGPGHVSATPLPGHGGNSVIVGHRDTHFAQLKRVKTDDIIEVRLPHKHLTYRVIKTFIVDEKNMEVMQNDGLDQLTLITCYPFDAIQPGGSLRYVVQAEII